ncbi:ClpP/crotonase [Ramaria rubella]|nr:ClpP/crotonase [Ramaria rubella]
MSFPSENANGVTEATQHPASVSSSTSSPSLAPSVNTGSTSSSSVPGNTFNPNIEPFILTARPPNSRVLIIRLNRPRVLNALSTTLIELLLSALRAADADPDVGAIVITGNDKVFAAGADIKELASLSFPLAYLSDYLRGLSEGVSKFKKPVIAAVNGHAHMQLGGGLELALACDTIFASTTATFGLPEVKLGTIPGAGGTQRLVRAIGKAKVSEERGSAGPSLIDCLTADNLQAMHLILTGSTLSSNEALSAGLIAKILPPEELLDAAVDAAQSMASYSAPIIAMAKEAILQADELSLADGIRFERRLYHSTFATADFVEGTKAFIEKRAPVWKNI